MSERAYSLDLFVPDPAGSKNRPVMVPLLTCVPRRDWEFNEGETRWLVRGVPIFDRECGLYPHLQLAAVLQLVEGSLLRVPRTAVPGGSRLHMGTTPMDAHHALFYYTGLGTAAERREVTASLREVAACVITAFDAIQQHLLAHHRDPLQHDLIACRDRCQSLSQQIGAKPLRSLHSKKPL